MRRFDYDNNDDYQDDVDSFFDEEDYDEEYEEGDDERYVMHKLSVIDMVQADLASMDLDQRLLAMAIAIAEKTWFWRFFSMQTKLQKIVEAYATLNVLMKEEEGGEEPEESE